MIQYGACMTSTDLNLRRLTYFVAVAEELHFGRAAIRLNMAQPPLSQQIQLLEEELGLRLFERSTRRVSLTAAGRRLYPEALAVITKATAFERSAGELRSGDGGVLRIGFVDSASYDVLPRLIRGHRARWPKVHYELQTLSSDEQKVELERGSIDLGIARVIPEGDFVASRIRTERLLAAINGDDRRASQKTTSLAALRHDRLVGFDRTVSPTLHSELAALFSAGGGRYDPAIEATEYTTILGLVAAGEGVAVVPASVRSFRPPQLHYVPIRDRHAQSALIFLRRAGDRSELIERVVAMANGLFGADTEGETADD